MISRRAPLPVAISPHIAVPVSFTSSIFTGNPISMRSGDFTSCVWYLHYHRGSALRDRPKSDFVNSILRLMTNLEVIKFYDVTSFTDFCDGSLEKLSSYSFREIHLYDVYFLENRLDHMCTVLQGSPKLERDIAANASRDLPLDSLPVVGVGHLSKIAFMITYGRDGPHYLRWWIQSLKRVTASDETPALWIMDIQLGPSFSLAVTQGSPKWNEFDQILSSPPFDNEFQTLTIQVQKRSPDEHVNQRDDSQLALPSEGVLGGATPRRSVEVRAKHLKVQFPRLAGKGKLSVKIIQCVYDLDF
ncbi:hypothetical protein EV421DRAFT_1783798 [Armillaria borealis]|uniref:Uncharacterized protein n=1 Tax=Armillaria borealis TaxID=47425 RepID=A0AA39MVK5_9AGAR|nr:hypothetical protein EV421DRAFT_1783798 [Armillaria borealis]